MARFMVRVVLHDADDNGSDYEELHGAMEMLGFSRIIESSKGFVYHLPPAEYHMEAELPIDDVRAFALQAAATTRRRHAVLVTEAHQIAWEGLERVKPASTGVTTRKCGLRTPTVNRVGTGRGGSRDRPGRPG